MTLKLSILITGLLLLLAPAKDQLVLEISGLELIEGNLYISLYDNESNWMNTDSANQKVMVPVTRNPEMIVMPNIPPGKYAIAIYQDLNDNEIMDETEIRIPKEPFGFSNNPRGLRGPASFKQASFEFNGQDTVRIKLVSNIFTPDK